MEIKLLIITLRLFFFFNKHRCISHLFAFPYKLQDYFYKLLKNESKRKRKTEERKDDKKVERRLKRKRRGKWETGQR